MSNYFREQKLTNLRDQKAGNKFESNLGNKDPSWEGLI